MVTSLVSKGNDKTPMNNPRIKLTPVSFESPRQNDLYNNINMVYRNAPRRRLDCHLPVVMLRSCEVRESQ